MSKNRVSWVFVFFMFFINMPFLVLMRGWTAKKLWDWFAVPIGLPHLSTSTLLGLALIVSALTATKTKDDDAGDAGESLWEIALKGLVYWGFFCGLILLEARIFLLFQ